MKCLVINPQNDPLYSDHLAPLAGLLSIPYMVKDAMHGDLVKRYYPGVDIRVSDQVLGSVAGLFQEYDLFYQPLFFQKEEFELMARQVGKRVRSVYCPHGYSDKPPIDTSRAYFDMNLIYGERMLELYRHYDMPEYMKNYSCVGNYRYQFYLNNRKFYDSLVEKEVFSRLPSGRPIIFYAPTWKDSHDSSTFFISCCSLLNILPEEYSCLVKLHPSLRRDYPEDVDRIMQIYENAENILILDNYQVTYPLLARVDYYVGDISSVGYDFLTFDRPMFFIDKLAGDWRENFNYSIFNVGTVVNAESLETIFESLDAQNDTFSSKRSALYNETFGAWQELKFNGI